MGIKLSKWPTWKIWWPQSNFFVATGPRSLVNVKPCFVVSVWKCWLSKNNSSLRWFLLDQYWNQDRFTSTIQWTWSRWGVQQVLQAHCVCLSCYQWQKPVHRAESYLAWWQGRPAGRRDLSGRFHVAPTQTDIKLAWWSSVLPAHFPLSRCFVLES